MKDAETATPHVEEKNRAEDVSFVKAEVRSPSPLVDELIDEEVLFTDEVFLEEDNFRGKRILIISSNPVNEYPWMKNAEEVVVLDLMENSNGQDSTPSYKVIRGSVEKLNYPDSHFDFVFLRDFSALSDNPDNVISELSRMIRMEGSVVLLSYVETNHSYFNLFLAEQFEKEFALIVEKHLEYFPRAGKQSLKKNPVFMHERMVLDRGGIIIARLEKKGKNPLTQKAVPPFRVDDYSYSTDKIEKVVPIDKKKMSDAVMENLSNIRVNPETAFKNLRQSMDRIYTQLGTRQF